MVDMHMFVIVISIIILRHVARRVMAVALQAHTAITLQCVRMLSKSERSQQET